MARRTTTVNDAAPASDDSLRAKVAATMGASALSLPPAQLHARILEVGSFWLQRLLPDLEVASCDQELLADEPRRSLVARLIVAALPEALRLFERLVAEPRSEGLIGELQFSLFVALSDVGDCPDYLGVHAQLVQIMRSFIEQVEVDEADAAWMAADVLGDHWPLGLTLGALRAAALGATHRAGREAALHGLSHALGRADKRQQWEIVEVAKQIERHDPDDAVRRYAGQVLGALRGL